MSTIQEQSHIPTKEHILGILAQSSTPLSIPAIIRLGGYKKKRISSIEELLRTLEASGLVSQEDGFLLSPAIPRLTGKFVIQRSGACFVIPEDKTVSETDIFIPLEGAGGAWARDTVEVLILKDKSLGRRSEGIVINIVARASSYVVAKILRKVTANTCLFIPINASIPTLFTATFSEDVLLNNNPDAIYLLRPIKEKTKTLWSADIIEVLGIEDDPITQENIVKIQFALQNTFPPEVVEELKAFPAEVDTTKYSGRKDLQSMPFVTIDGADSRDFDDAICLIKKANGYILYVAVADVTEYVTPNSSLDKEAMHRSNSYYFPQSVIPMLPEALSNILCSLQAHVPRLAMVVEMHYSEDGILEEKTAYEAIICSHGRLTYKEVQEYLNTKETLSIGKNEIIEEMLDITAIFTKKLCKKRYERGGLFFETTSPHFIFADKEIENIVVYAHYYAHSLIEECMLAANEAIAQILTIANFPVLYRIHPNPTVEKLEKLEQYVTYMYPRNTLPKSTEPHFLPALLAFVKGKPEEEIIHLVAIRSMMQARYSPLHEEHFGLQSTTYCHFTSPIRRYSDILVHRALKALLHGKSRDTISSEEELSTIADILNLNERTALDAEREIQKRLAILYIRKHLDVEYTVMVAGISTHSIFVEFPAMSIFGVIALSALSDDYYEVIEAQQRVEGIRTGKSYALGDTLTVRVLEASISALEIQCLPVELIGKKASFSGKRYPKKTSRTATSIDRKEKRNAPKGKKASSKSGGSFSSEKKRNDEIETSGEKKKGSVRRKSSNSSTKDFSKKNESNGFERKKSSRTKKSFHKK